MTGWIRAALVAVVAGHAALHLLGAVKGLGWAAVPQLRQHIGVAAGWGWLTAAVTVGVTVGVAAVVLAVGVRWWWAVAALSFTRQPWSTPVRSSAASARTGS